MKVLKANSIYKLGFLFFQSLFILILSRILGPDSFGTYSLIMVNAALFNLFTGWGVPSGIMYHASIGDISMYTLNRFSNNTLAIQLIICFVIEFLVFSFSGSFMIWPTNHFQFAFIGILAVISLSLMERSYAFYNGYNKLLTFHKISFYFSLIIFILVCISLLYVPFFNWKILIILIINIQLIQGFFSKIYFQTKFKNAKESISKTTLSSGAFYNYSILSFLGNALWLMVSKIDIIIINKFASHWDLGQYSLASRFSQLFYIIPQFFAGILFPWFCSSRFDKNVFEILLRVIFILHLGLGIFIYFSADYFIPYFFGNQYAETIHLLFPVLIGSAALSVQIVLAAFFAAQNKLWLNIKTMLISLVLLVSLDIILVPSYGILGASFSLAISYISAFVYAVNNYKKGKESWNILKPRLSDFQFVIYQIKTFREK